MVYEAHTCNACIIIKLGYPVRMYHNSMDSNPNRATARWNSLAKTWKNMITRINHIFMMKNIKNNKKHHIFTPPRPLGSGGVKIWGFLLFLNIVKIGNNDFITILGSVNLNIMMFTANYCSNLIENVHRGSVTHIEYPWTLNITFILFSESEDPILGLKNRFIIILMDFINELHLVVARIGLEFIGLVSICTKYINFLMIHTQHMYPSYPVITRAFVPY